MRHVSEGFAVSFTACVPLVLKFTLQVADVLYCIFKPTLERLSQLHFVSQLYFVRNGTENILRCVSFAVVFGLLIVYRNGTVTRTIVFPSIWHVYLWGVYFLFDSISQGDKVSARPSNTRQWEAVTVSLFFPPPPNTAPVPSAV